MQVSVIQIDVFTIAGIGNLPRKRKLVVRKLAALGTRRRELKGLYANFLAGLILVLRVKIASNLFNIHETRKLVRTSRFHFDGRIGDNRIIARIRSNVYPSKCIIVRNGERGRRLAINNMPVALVKIGGIGIDLRPTPRERDALGNRFVFPIIALVGNRFDRGARILRTLGRIGIIDVVKRRRALCQNAAWLRFMRIDTGNAVLGRCNDLEIFSSVITNGERRTSCYFAIFAIFVIGNLPREIDLVFAIQIGRRIVVKVVRRSTNRVADVRIGNVFNLIAEFFAIVGENDMVNGKLINRRNWTRGIVFNRSWTIKRTAWAIELLTISGDFNSNVFASKLLRQILSNGQGLRSLAFNGKISRIVRIATIASKPLIRPSVLRGNASRGHCLAIVGICAKHTSWAKNLWLNNIRR